MNSEVTLPLTGEYVTISELAKLIVQADREGQPSRCQEHKFCP